MSVSINSNPQKTSVNFPTIYCKRCIRVLRPLTHIHSPISRQISSIYYHFIYITGTGIYAARIRSYLYASSIHFESTFITKDTYSSSSSSNVAPIQYYFC